MDETGVVLGIDLDGDAIANAQKTIGDNRLKLWQGNYQNIRAAAHTFGFTRADGILFDLGVSSYQIDTAERGFSYIKDAPLDMRMDQSAPVSAADVVNAYPPEKLIQILYEYGEERFSRKIVAAIIASRGKSPIKTTAELANLIAEACPGYKKNQGHPAKRTFQALRIEVNGELEGLDAALTEAVDMLSPGGRLAVLSFHSLEDRKVKNVLASFVKPCTCPKEYPLCVCGKKPSLKTVTKKPLVCSEKEYAENSRSHSAKLRIAEKLESM